MKIVIIDDEKLTILMLQKRLSELNGSNDFTITTFTDSEEGLSFILKNHPDIVFLDIEMPGLSGLDVAEALMDDGEDRPGIIFQTAYPQFALDAWKLDAADYVLKPYNTEQIEKALQRAVKLKKISLDANPAIAEGKPKIRCFPEFEVYKDTQPLDFVNRRAKELLALLVHHRGDWLTIDKMAYALFEDADENISKNHTRVLLTRLRQALNAYGILEILETQRGKARIVPEAIDCDYYRYLNGEKDLFHGEYMGNYTWAEVELAYMCRKEGIDF